MNCSSSTFWVLPRATQALSFADFRLIVHRSLSITWEVGNLNTATLNKNAEKSIWKFLHFIFDKLFQQHYIFSRQPETMIVFIASFCILFFLSHFFLQQIVRFYWQMPKSLNIQLSIAMKHFARWAVSVGLKWCKKHAGKFLFHPFFHSQFRSHQSQARKQHSFPFAFFAYTFFFAQIPKTKLTANSEEQKWSLNKHCVGSLLGTVYWKCNAFQIEIYIICGYVCVV